MSRLHESFENHQRGMPSMPWVPLPLGDTCPFQELQLKPRNAPRPVLSQIDWEHGQFAGQLAIAIIDHALFEQRRWFDDGFPSTSFNGRSASSTFSAVNMPTLLDNPDLRLC